MNNKPQIPQSEVEKAQALARHHTGQAARAKGYDATQFRALASYGKPTIIPHAEGDLTLLPQTLQVQLCLIEHAKLFPPSAGLTVADGIQRLTHLALIYIDPDQAFDLLTNEEVDEENRRRNFTHEAFRLARYFTGQAEIELLSAHVVAQMQLTDQATEASAKKPPAPKVTGGPRKVRISRK